MSNKLIAALLSSVMISSAMFASACVTTHDDSSTQRSGLEIDIDPQDCFRPAEEVLAEHGVLPSVLAAFGDEAQLAALLAPFQAVCDAVPDPAPPAPVPGPTTEPGVPGQLETVAFMADTSDTILKCILGIVGADIAMDLYEAIKVPWGAGLRGKALAKDAGEILWNRVKKKGLKYALKALGGIGGAIACFIDIVSGVAKAEQLDHATVTTLAVPNGPGCPHGQPVVTFAR